jgi:ABC-type polysaccharide/polyol phosphate transport system ATPase subunit
MIKLENVRKAYPTRFGEKVVLEDVGFELAMGERLGVLGRNGAGKSTMVRLISGAERPTQGRIERHMSISWPLAFGGAFQTILTGQDNLRFISRVYGQDFESNLDFVEEFAELGPYLREPVRTYSSGMRARLAFAISMIIDFDCFLIDEIASVGDARFHSKCNYELFEKRADRAMVIVSHDPGYIRDHCTRWAVLHNGRLSHFDDFEVAYDFYSDRIGLATDHKSAAVRFKNRATALETLYYAAISDERFMIHVQRGDWARDRHDWSTADAEYAAGLALHPYERTYWAQRGHALIAQGKSVAAEIAYRTSCALGFPVRDLRDFIAAAMAQQGVDAGQFPVRGLIQGPVYEQPPSLPDLEILGELFWHTNQFDQAEALSLLRTSRTLDDLATLLIRDERKVTSGTSRIKDSSAPPDLHWLAHLCHLVMPDFDYADTIELERQIPSRAGALRRLIDLKAFVDWPKTSVMLDQIFNAN